MYNYLKKEGDLYRKNKAFSTFEIILSILIFSILLNIAFLKYKEFKELRDINEAKTKITEAFLFGINNFFETEKKARIRIRPFCKKNCNIR